MLTVAPELRPNSASGLPMTGTSASASIGRTVRTAPHTGLVDRRQVAIAVVHVGAVEQVVVGAAAIAVQREQPIGTRRFRRTHRIACRPRNQFEQLGKSRPLIGNSATSEAAIVPPVVLEVVSTSGTSALTSTVSSPRRRPVCVRARWRAHAYRDLVQRGSPESLFFNGDAVGAQRQFGGLIFALVIRGHSA